MKIETIFKTVEIFGDELLHYNSSELYGNDFIKSAIFKSDNFIIKGNFSPLNHTITSIYIINNKLKIKLLVKYNGEKIIEIIKMI